MDNSSIREKAHEMADWMANYFENIDQYRVLPDVQPGEIKNQLPSSPPEQPEDFDAIMRDFNHIIMPGMTHWQHPGFMAYFPASRSAPSVLAETLTATLGAQCMVWYTSPAAEELEDQTMEWLRQMIGLPHDFTGVIQETASASTLVALLMAREKKTGFEINKKGFYGHPPLRVYASEQIHSSINKAVRIAGLGEDNLVLIPCLDDFAIDTIALKEAIEEDLKNGFQPLALVGAFGTTSSTAIDDLNTLADIAANYQLFFHVDAAYCGNALVLSEIRELALGIERADSVVFNPHKWMFTNFDCSAFFVKDTHLLTQVFSITPAYLKTPQDRLVHNYRDWGIQLGRRFRALKLWFVLRSYGVKGIQEKIRNHIEYGKWLAAEMRATNGYEVVAPVLFNLVCFRYVPRQYIGNPQAINKFNQLVLQKINESGDLFLTGTTLSDYYVIRVVAGQTDTRKEDLERAWKRIKDAVNQLEQTY
jgi:aromatic-L-amino-acid decarboxylase